MRMCGRFLVCAVIMAVLVVIWSLTVHAAVPQTMNYQGYLTNSSGQPVNGQVSMTFKLYTVASGGSALWSETQGAVEVNKGVYSVILGSVTPIDLPFDAQYWIGVMVGTDPEMTPRQALLSVPYSRRSGCNPGDYMGCYTAAPGTRDVGVCRGGVRTCAPDGAGFGPCAGEVVPTQEVCYNQTDEDCDGALDNGCAPRVCVPDTSIQCYSGPMGTQGVGICKAGTMTCNQEGSGYGSCIGEVLPQAEVCGNGKDDNCNGQVDEGCTFPNGSACSINSQCTSGNCVDNFCCNTSCAGLCMTCSLAKGATANGICSPVMAFTDPDNECPGAQMCSGAGFCE